MKAYYGDRFSPNMTKTPEGYLICHDVPIGRIGSQQYLPNELGIKTEGIITVLRNEDEVFKPASMASFESKPVTDNHPPEDVTPSNYCNYTKGVVQNVHRGKGENADKILADLVIYDANLICEIEAGKREISCGYDCDYIDNDDGTFHQANIIGNHVAVVDKGRAGPSVSIKDEKPKGVEIMSKKENIFKRMYNRYIKDAEPDEIAEATRAMDALEQPQASEEKETADNDPIAKLTDAVNALNQKVADMEQQLNQPKEETSSLDALENELSGENTTTDEPDETSVTIPPEQINDEDTTSCEKPEKASVTDSAIALKIIRAIKPEIAKLPNEQRKKMSDSLSKAVRDAMMVQPTQQFQGGYSALAKPKKTVDNAVNANNLRAFGENCRKRNPHLNK